MPVPSKKFVRLKGTMNTSQTTRVIPRDLLDDQELPSK